MTRVVIVITALAIIAATFLSALVVSGGAEPAPVIVRGDALGNTIEVRGRLDAPLGKLLTVRGEMVEESFGNGVKNVDAKEYVRVRQVGDRKLETPVIVRLGHFWDGDPALVAGTAIELIGYETGGFGGAAPAVYEWARFDHRNKHRGGMGPASNGFYFELRFDVLSYQTLWLQNPRIANVRSMPPLSGLRLRDLPAPSERRRAAVWELKPIVPSEKEE